MAKWSTSDIRDQSGRLAVVTGANSGIGFVAARELARAGARVVLAVRDTGRGEDAARKVRSAASTAEVEVMELDLADLFSVRSFATAFGEAHDGLDLLVNNAGVMALPHRTTSDGFEMQFGTNHLGHFALTGLLLPRLSPRPDPRVVTVSSGAHKMGKIDFGDLQGERSYKKWKAYGQSKLANLLFAFELARRASAAGLPLTSVAAHPGYAATNLQATGPRMAGRDFEERLMGVINRVVAQDEEHGALPTLYAATEPHLPSGSYIGPDGPLEMWGRPRLVGASDRAWDEQTARRLWETSEELTGVHYDFGAVAAGA
ncbi:MAG: probable oxidoreductase/Short-chain dehydrogenase [uncultured Solirubrobacterales bacterium]|uniref:Probable oxidoreductase/Short-chain dehydrogenase n=1 Tax=uncultured Solirubrobacterales bacterium TaxID=768556 RepID=A0A6J4SV93_9ACTN|nr:MAG: probable oxidoreductase/Short-chain dehydrogenase [uncultured Solirubrobacterales bacterium]